MIKTLSKAFRLLIAPELRWYVLGPLLVNISLFSALGMYVFSLIPELINSAVGYLPDWLSWLSWLIAPVVVITVIIIGISTFNILGNIIAAPLNAFLSEKVEKLEMGANYQPSEDISLMAEVTHAFAREIRKLMYYLPRFLLVLILSVIPGVNVFAPIIWFAFGAWLMAFQYFDYPLDNNRFNFSQSRKWIHQRPISSLSFGSVTSLLFLVPGLNLFMMPLCVVWATLLWLEQKK